VTPTVADAVPTGAAGRPKASFVVITYNHVGLISTCLDGLLAQRVDFPVEIIVHDDGSTDGTVDVLHEYARAHPARFTLLLQPQCGGSAGAAMSRALTAATGEYVLFCDGDDFWTDVDKAATQVGLLESRPDLGFCFHDVERRSLDGSTEYLFLEDGWRRDWTSAQIAAADFLFIPQSSVAFRNIAKPYPPEMALSVLSDMFLTRILGHVGNGAYVGDRIRPTVAFAHPTSSYASEPAEQRARMAKIAYLVIMAWLLRIGRDEEAQAVARTQLVPRLTGQVGPPPPHVTWRHPGSLLLAWRHRRRWGGQGRRDAGATVGVDTASAPGRP